MSPSWVANNLVTQLVKKSHTFWATRRWNTVFRKTRHWALFSARIESTSSDNISLTVSSLLCLRLPSGLYSSDFPTKILCAFPISLLGTITACTSHITLFDLITLAISGEEHKLYSSLLFSFLRVPVSFSPPPPPRPTNLHLPFMSFKLSCSEILLSYCSFLLHVRQNYWSSEWRTTWSMTVSAKSIRSPIAHDGRHQVSNIFTTMDFSS